jgi:hypothetical protein
MKLPISWLKDYIDLDGLSVEDIARKLTLAGMEVDEILYAGLEMPVYKEGEKHEFKTNGIAWDKEKIVVAEILQDKIFLDASNQLRTVSDKPSAGGPPQLDLANLD